MPLIRVNNVAVDPSTIQFARYYPEGWGSGPPPALQLNFERAVELIHGDDARLLWPLLHSATSEPASRADDAREEAPADDDGRLVLDESAVTQLLIQHARLAGGWSGTVRSLLDELRNAALAEDLRDGDIPATPRGLSASLRRLRDALAAEGVIVRFRPKRQDGRHVDIFWRPGK